MFATPGRVRRAGRVRRRLERDPKALEEELDIVLPTRLRVQLVQEQPDSLCIVLPVDLTGMSEAAAGSMAGRPVAAQVDPASPWG